MGHFGTRLHTQSMWHCGTCPTPEVGEMPYIQRRNLGSVIAIHWLAIFGNRLKAGKPPVFI